MTVKPWMTSDIRKEIEGMIKSEVTTQLRPVLADLGQLKVQNMEQSRMVGVTQGKVADIDDWKNKLWGNGSGNEGYLEKARREDKTRLDSMQAGFDKMATHIEIEKTVSSRVAEVMEKAAVVKDKSKDRVIAIVGVIATLLAGGLIEHLFNLLHASGH